MKKNVVVGFGCLDQVGLEVFRFFAHNKLVLRIFLVVVYIYIHIMCIEIKTMASQKKRWDLQIYKVGATRSDKYIAHWKDCATLKSWA